MNEKTYLDFAATTPVDERVLQAMAPYFSADFGNPSSIHRFGQKAEYAVETAREIVAGYIHAEPEEIIFTSCGSESNNLALRGTAHARKNQTGSSTLLSARTEHHAVSKTVEQLEAFFGFHAHWLNVNEHGQSDVRSLKSHLGKDVALVSLMYANNEVGSINDISALAGVCAEKGVPFHTDAVQAASTLPIDVRSMPVSLLSLGGHKLYGPKGVGALYVRKGTPILPMQTGGGQENGLRAGTHNVPFIVGFGKAIELLQSEREERAKKMANLRDMLIERVLAGIPDCQLTGHPTQRLPQHASFVFKGVDGNLLLSMLDSAGYACSSGSACKTGNPEPSEVLTAIGLERDWALGSLRVTLGTTTTKQDITRFCADLPALIEKNRALTRHGKV